MTRSLEESTVLRSRTSEPTMGNRGETNAIQEEEDGFVKVDTPAASYSSHSHPPPSTPTDCRTGTKAARVLGIQHVPSMTPVPATTRKNSILSTRSARSARDALPATSHIPSLPLTSLYVVSGLPKSAHTWTLGKSVYWVVPAPNKLLCSRSRFCAWFASF